MEGLVVAGLLVGTFWTGFLAGATRTAGAVRLAGAVRATGALRFVGVLATGVFVVAAFRFSGAFVEVACLLTIRTLRLTGLIVVGGFLGNNLRSATIP